MNKHGAITQFIDDLNHLGGLKNVDIANITEVSNATVTRWKSGAARPHANTQLLLATLFYIVGRLMEYYTPEDIRLWLYSPHPQLNGERAIDVINSGRAVEVISILDRLDSGAHL